MLLTILNLTAESLSFRVTKRSKPDEDHGSFTALESSSATTISLKRGSELVLRPSICDTSFEADFKEWTIIPDDFTIQLSLMLGALWRAIPVPNWCTWRIYLTKTSKKHYTLTIITRRNTASFLSEMPDTLPLSSLCLPGTHDTMAFYGWPVSQCQSLSTPLSVQLQAGIRVLDIRLAIVKSRLIAYHGIFPQRASFQEILATVHAFLSAPETSCETIVMSIKQEDFAKNSYMDFSRLVKDEIANGPGGRKMWFLKNRVPTLGEVRGKVVMFSRFGGNGEGWDDALEGLGIHPLVWPDSAKFGFSWHCKKTLVRTHDWYNIPSFIAIPEKVALATQILLPAPNNPPGNTLSISFLSAASFPFAFPPAIAAGVGWPKWGLGVEGVNSRVTHWLLTLLGEHAVKSKNLEDGPRIRGWVLMDFFTDPEAGLVPLLIECNFRGRRSGEEGW